MTHIDSIIAPGLFATMIEERYIKATRHPTEPLTIYNYTPKTAFGAGTWNEATLACRGLIVGDDKIVVARPFPKFFNLGQTGAPPTPTSPFEAYHKMDGSLGILYMTPDGPEIATRGSFTSDQALHATAVLKERFDFEPAADVTYLVEIIFPENRIVVDYSDTDTLVLLAVIDNSTGHTLQHGTYGWPGPIVEVADAETITDLDLSRAGSEAEGYVLHWPAENVRLKVKGEDYLRLHRLLTCVSTKTVWEVLSANDEVALLSYLTDVPDEFRRWVNDTATELSDEKELWEATAWYWFKRTQVAMGRNKERKWFAREVEATVPEQYRGAVFSLLDDRPIDGMSWKAVRPAYAKAFSTPLEESA